MQVLENSCIVKIINFINFEFFKLIIKTKKRNNKIYIKNMIYINKYKYMNILYILIKLSLYKEILYHISYRSRNDGLKTGDRYEIFQKIKKYIIFY